VGEQPLPHARHVAVEEQENIAVELTVGGTSFEHEAA
jgi:hypothetical protein